jgi:5-formyltetrahydrofolate cyclo-ligase
MTKSELRRALREARRAFVATRGGNDFVAHHLDVQLKSLLKSETIIAIYQASNNECSYQNLDIFSGHAVVLPCADTREDRLIFRKWAAGDWLELSPLGFRQPPKTADQMTPTLIITPLLGFDRKLNRLGQGAGHYDRAFFDYPQAIRIGLAWSVQEVTSLTPDLWDVPLDVVVTEREWITAPHSRLD